MAALNIAHELPARAITPAALNIEGLGVECADEATLIRLSSVHRVGARPTELSLWCAKIEYS